MKFGLVTAVQVDDVLPPFYAPGVAGHRDDVLEDHIVSQEVEVVLSVDETLESFPDDAEEGAISSEICEPSLVYSVDCPPRRGVHRYGSVALSGIADCADVSRSVMIDVTGFAGTVFPGCLRWSGCGTEIARVHEYRERTAADVPVDGRAGVLVKVKVRRTAAGGPGLRSADVPRAGPGRPGPLPAAHHAADRASQRGRPGN